MTDTVADPRRGAWIPWVFVAAFLVVVAANGALIVFATATFNGLTTNDAYREGIAFNRTLDQAADQARLGWTITPSFRATGDRAGVLELAAAGRAGIALAGADVSVALTRPTHDGHDFAVALPAQGAGRYGAAIAFPLPGIWDASITVTRDGAVTHLVRRLVVR